MEDLRRSRKYDDMDPQDQLVASIIDKLMSEKMGDDWQQQMKPQQEESRFSQTIKQFHCPSPKHNIQFGTYKKELNDAIQLGTSPVFGYPLLSFQERDLSHDRGRNHPVQLNSKFRLGKPRARLQSEIQAEQLLKLQEKIERQDAYMQDGKKIEEFYKDENERVSRKIDYSELKNLPSPIFKVFAQSDKAWLADLIFQKNQRESSLQTIDEAFTKGTSLKLVKRNAQLADYDETPNNKAQKQNIKRMKNRKEYAGSPKKSPRKQGRQASMGKSQRNLLAQFQSHQASKNASGSPDARELVVTSNQNQEPLKLKLKIKGKTQTQKREHSFKKGSSQSPPKSVDSKMHMQQGSPFKTQNQTMSLNMQSLNNRQKRQSTKFGEFSPPKTVPQKVRINSAAGASKHANKTKNLLAQRKQNQNTNIEGSFQTIVQELSPGQKTENIHGDINNTFNDNTLKKEREKNPSSFNQNYNVSTHKSTIATDQRSSPLMKASQCQPFSKQQQSFHDKPHTRNHDKYINQMYSPESSMQYDVGNSEYKFNFTVSKPKVNDKVSRTTVTNLFDGNTEDAAVHSTVLSEDNKHDIELEDEYRDFKHDLFKNDTGFKGLLARKRGTISPGKKTQNYSSSCISRSDLKFRIRYQKSNQKQVFRNTIKSITKLADLESKEVDSNELRQLYCHSQIVPQLDADTFSNYLGRQSEYSSNLRASMSNQDDTYAGFSVQQASETPKNSKVYLNSIYTPKKKFTRDYTADSGFFTVQKENTFSGSNLVIQQQRTSASTKKGAHQAPMFQSKFSSMQGMLFTNNYTSNQPNSIRNEPINDAISNSMEFTNVALSDIGPEYNTVNNQKMVREFDPIHEAPNQLESSALSSTMAKRYQNKRVTKVINNARMKSIAKRGKNRFNNNSNNMRHLDSSGLTHNGAESSGQQMRATDIVNDSTNLINDRQNFYPATQSHIGNGLSSSPDGGYGYNYIKAYVEKQQKLNTLTENSYQKGSQ